ncbi:SusC/RagA family TonB-linked outer membrane protein [Niabella drilacis]|uniref:TonB-linked outer membrane protein, SusC/RagA family n=1 Tax=Niabella drilacis (strain DSM 25811 / CCM 8410 / CCUG 62505 / LMG 26954 / E90) TaxID=1285928 RepID=A0A1G6X3S1_NIADE|nr:TonB-dependent receptor [Niabella drilacis]SDD72830.1 TonB-linked outer membrane protein, SusC/RagA family [Niabella drilacis]
MRFISCCLGGAGYCPFFRRLLAAGLFTAGLFIIVFQSRAAPLRPPADGGAASRHLPAFSWVLKGNVTNTRNEPVNGASVSVKGSAGGVSTDKNGAFMIEVASESDSLIVSAVGYRSKTVAIGNARNLDVVLEEDLEKQKMDEVVVVAYGQQKKESMVSSITTVNPKEIKGPTSNLTTMLAGRIAGMISYQRSGEPGADNASFFIRGITSFGAGKIDPLILIDGMESTPTDLARMQPDDIAGFSVLKDAAASSLYGARGANGVILLTTKSGTESKIKVNFRFENSVSSNTQNFKLADNITYMKLANEAVLTRTPPGSKSAPQPYSQTKIDRTAAGWNPMLYPNNDWMGILIKDYTMNQRFNMNLAGGGKVARYYIAGTFNIDNGVLKNDALNRYDNNIKLKSYQVRSNVNIKLTPTTEGIVRTSGTFDDYQGPIGGGAGIFSQALSSNPVLFPAVYPASALPLVKHPLFGNALIGSGNVFYNNPYANMVAGFQQYNTSTLNVQIEVKQDFDFITKGLSARVMGYTQRYSYFDLSRRFNPFFYGATPTDSKGEHYNLVLLNEQQTPPPTEYLNYQPGIRKANTTTYMEAAVNYNRTFHEKHAIGGLLVTILRNYLTANADDLQAALPARNQGLSGRFTYGYDNRYLFETNFGYNGSERFAKNNRYGFFPSVGVAWNVSNEQFFEPLRSAVSRLKLRATYGLVGNDQIGNPADRFFYMANVNLNGGNLGGFGTDYSYSRPGVSITRYPNENITWEKSKTTNIGMDLTVLKSLNLVVDVYRQHRSNILMKRSFIPTTMGLAADIQANVGEAESKGIDVSLDYNRTFGDLWISGRGTFTYATSKLLVNEEPDFGNLTYLSHVGNSLGQNYGYIAERLFVDDEEVRNSPRQAFGTGLEPVRGGDIKYRDVNGDGIISSLDIVPLGLPTSPEIVYGFGVSTGYKKFDISGFFQGSARSSFWIDPSAITPFALNGANQNGLLQVIADSYWSEDNRDMRAFWPRLSSTVNANNTQTSNWWMRNGSFLRLKSVELGYNLSGRSVTRWGIGSIRIYASGTNLFVKSSFKLWDPEQGGNGLGYPLQRVYNFGVNVQF